MTEEIYQVTTGEPAKYAVSVYYTFTKEISGVEHYVIHSAYVRGDLGAEYKIKALSGNTSVSYSVKSGYGTYWGSISDVADAVGEVIFRKADLTEITRVALPLLNPLEVENVRFIDVYIKVGCTSAYWGTTYIAFYGISTILFKVLGS